GRPGGAWVGRGTGGAAGPAPVGARASPPRELVPPHPTRTVHATSSARAYEFVARTGGGGAGLCGGARRCAGWGMRGDGRGWWVVTVGPSAARPRRLLVGRCALAWSHGGGRAGGAALVTGAAGVRLRPRSPDVPAAAAADDG